MCQSKWHLLISMILVAIRSLSSPDDHCSHQIQSVSRSDDHCSHQIQSVSRSDDHCSHQIQSVSRSDDHCSHQIQSVSRSDGGSAPRDDLYNSEHQQRPGHLDEPQKQMPMRTSSPRQLSGKDHWNQWSPYNLTMLQLEQLVRLARGKLPPD